MGDMNNMNNEINLLDYLKIVLKRKKMIFLVFVLAILLGFILTAISPKIYKIETVLEIGQVGEDLVENPGQIVEKITNNAYGNYDLKIMARNPKNTALISLVLESSMPQQDKGVFEKIINLILEDHQKEVDLQKDLIKKDIEKLGNKIGLIEEDIKNNQKKIFLVEDNIKKTRNKIGPIKNDIERIESKISYTKEEQKNLEDKVNALEEVLVYEQTPGTQFALFDTKEKLENKKQEIENLYLSINSLQRTIDDLNIQINSLQSDKEDYNIEINSLGFGKNDLLLETNSLNKELGNIKTTKVVKQASISKYPVKPRLFFNLIIAGVLGVFVGILFAFAKEWWQKSKI